MDWYVADDPKRDTRQIVVELPSGGSEHSKFENLMLSWKYENLLTQPWCAGYFRTDTERGPFLLVRADDHVEKLRNCPLRVAFTFYREPAGGLFGLYVEAKNEKLARLSQTGHAVFECCYGLDSHDATERIEEGLSRDVMHLCFAEASSDMRMSMIDGAGTAQAIVPPTCRFDRVVPISEDCRQVLKKEFSQLLGYHRSISPSTRDYVTSMQQLNEDWPATVNPILGRENATRQDHFTKSKPSFWRRLFRKSSSEKSSQKSVTKNLKKHDWRMRKKGIQELDDSKDAHSLIEAAKSDADWRVRWAAVGKVTSQSVLEYVAENDVSPEVRSRAVVKLTDKKILERISSSDPDERVKTNAGKFICQSTTNETQSREEYFRECFSFPASCIEVRLPDGEARCEDEGCACGAPGAPIPQGEGYIVVTSAAADFRSDALSIAAAEEKLRRRFGKRAYPLGEKASFAPILVCENSIAARALDIEVASADARVWWDIGLVPARATPSARRVSDELRKNVGGGFYGWLSGLFNETQSDSFQRYLEDQDVAFKWYKEQQFGEYDKKDLGDLLQLSQTNQKAEDCCDWLGLIAGAHHLLDGVNANSGESRNPLDWLVDTYWVPRSLEHLGLAHTGLESYEIAALYLSAAFKSLDLEHEVVRTKREVSVLLNTAVLALLSADVELYNVARSRLESLGTQSDEEGLDASHWAGELFQLGNKNAQWRLDGKPVLRCQRHATGYYALSAELNRELGDGNALAITLANLGKTYSTLGEFERSTKFLGEARGLLESLGDSELIGTVDSWIEEAASTVAPDQDASGNMEELHNLRERFATVVFDARRQAAVFEAAAKKLPSASEIEVLEYILDQYERDNR